MFSTQFFGRCRRWTRSRTTFLLAVFAAASACGPLAPANAATSAGGSGVTAREIHIGMVNAQTGPASALGQGMRTGAQAVFDEVNARGGIHGRKIVLNVADDAYEPEQTVEHTLKLVQQDGVLALFGFVGTPTVNAVIPLISEMRVPLVGVFSGAQSLRMPVVPEIFNVRASYDEEAEALVQRLLADGAKKVAVVYQNDGFGVSVLSGTSKALARRGVKVSATASFQRNTTAVRMALASMLENQPDAVIIVGPYAPVTAFIRQAHGLGLQSRFATVSFAGIEGVLARVSTEGDNMLISQVVPSPDSANLPVVSNCRQAVLRATGQPMGFISLEGCISARLLVRALELSGPGLTRELLMQNLEKMGSEDLGGLTAKLSAENHQAFSRVYLTRIADGKLVSLPE
jgi:branched-chain amino acid transport system substrate-binding protein